MRSIARRHDNPPNARPEWSNAERSLLSSVSRQSQTAARAASTMSAALRRYVCAGACAVGGQPGTRFELHVGYHDGYAHLPIVTLRRVALN